MTWQDIEGAKQFIIIVAIISFITSFWGIHKKESYLVSFLTSAIISTILSISFYLLAIVYHAITNSSSILEGSLAVVASIFFSLLGLPVLILYIVIGIICGSVPGASVSCCLQKILKKNKEKT